LIAFKFVDGVTFAFDGVGEADGFGEAADPDADGVGAAELVVVGVPPPQPARAANAAVNAATTATFRPEKRTGEPYLP
jgi:hypothetical protein